MAGEHSPVATNDSVVVVTVGPPGVTAWATAW